MRYSILIMFVTLLVIDASNAETWRGLEVAPENRCSPFDRKSQYPYPQSVEDEIVRSIGGKVYGPYTGRYFKTDSETDIEHIVSVSEGHDSGLCKASPEVRIAFATDPLNLTLAAPNVNRCGAGGKCGYPKQPCHACDSKDCRKSGKCKWNYKIKECIRKGMI